MPTFEELQNRYERNARTREGQVGPVETVERDSRADLSPKEFVEEKLRSLANGPPRFAAQSKLIRKPR